jgi:hypothetical protein
MPKKTKKASEKTSYSSADIQEHGGKAAQNQNSACEISLGPLPRSAIITSGGPSAAADIIQVHIGSDITIAMKSSKLHCNF